MVATPSLAEANTGRRVSQSKIGKGTLLGLQGGNMSNRFLRCGALNYFILLLSCLSQPAWSQESAGLKRIRIGMPNRGATTLGLSAAQTYGFLRTQGLYAELIVMRPSSSLQTLMSGDLDFSTALASGARASVCGLPLRIVMTFSWRQDSSLVVRPETR